MRAIQYPYNLLLPIRQLISGVRKSSCPDVESGRFHLSQRTMPDARAIANDTSDDHNQHPEQSGVSRWHWHAVNPN